MHSSVQALSAMGVAVDFGITQVGVSTGMQMLPSRCLATSASCSLNDLHDMVHHIPKGVSERIGVSEQVVDGNVGLHAIVAKNMFKPAADSQS